MKPEKAISMIDEYLEEPNSIDKEWIECLRLCRQALLESESQKEQINGLIAGQETLQKHLAEKNAEIEKKNTEIDILIRKKGTLRDEISELNAEIERFENIKATINKFWDMLLKCKIAKRKDAPTLEEFAEAIGEIEAEAIKEFAREFVADLSHMLTYDKDYIKAKIFKLIDTRQKEIVGTKTDTSVSLVDGHIDE